MGNLSKFCTCTNLDCPLHPSRHDRGCAPCIQKNLRLKEIPGCFFNSLGGARGRSGDGYEDFAALVLEGRRPRAEE